MQAGALTPDAESSFVNALRPLCILLLKFPNYFTAESLKKAMTILKANVPDELTLPHLNLYSEFIGQYLSNLEQWTCLHPDYLGYYSAESCAIRQTGVMKELVDTIELYLQFLSEVGEAVG